MFHYRLIEDPRNVIINASRIPFHPRPIPESVSRVLELQGQVFEGVGY